MPRPEKKQGTKNIKPVFTDTTKHNPQRKHFVPDKDAPQVPPKEIEPLGVKTFVTANRKTQDEFSVDKKMGKKVQVTTLYEKRNGLPMRTLGDKEYATPEYQKGFFNGGGLIVGST